MGKIVKMINSFGKIPAIILILGLTVQIVYLIHTPYNIRSNDADDHIKYIEYVAQNYNIPDWSLCWECHQAPFYYILAGSIYKASTVFGISDKAVIYFILQAFSLFLFSIFSLVSVLILRKIFITNRNEENKKTSSRYYIYYLVSFLFVFWPTNIINSARITNDILFNLFYVLVLFFLIRWLDKKENRDFYFSIFFSLLAFITKAHGLLAFALVGACALFIFVKDKKRFGNLKFYIKKAGLLFIIFLVGFFGSRLGARAIDKVKGGEEKRNIMVWNVGGGLNHLLFTENKVQNYIYFDTKIFLTEPYINNWDDRYGRQYFWNFLLKNSLFGEFFFNGIVAQNIAIGILPILISVSSFAGVGILEYRRRGLKNMEIIGYAIFSSFVILSILFFTFAVFLDK
ncbi:MAG: phospholipid carrier-dependent glycosyltransferase [Parcubacteria group bacterium]|nr:phospholipid carrier-dependent glycosyltransferase [Parcubacteria group bacterium]